MYMLLYPIYYILHLCMLLYPIYYILYLCMLLYPIYYILYPCMLLYPIYYILLVVQRTLIKFGLFILAVRFFPLVSAFCLSVNHCGFFNYSG